MSFFKTQCYNNSFVLEACTTSVKFKAIFMNLNNVQLTFSQQHFLQRKKNAKDTTQQKRCLRASTKVIQYLNSCFTEFLWTC